METALNILLWPMAAHIAKIGRKLRTYLPRASHSNRKTVIPARHITPISRNPSFSKGAKSAHTKHKNKTVSIVPAENLPNGRYSSPQCITYLCKGLTFKGPLSSLYMEPSVPSVKIKLRLSITCFIIPAKPFSPIRYFICCILLHKYLILS